MLGLPDRFHAFVVFQRFRQRCRSRVTDVVVAESARIANEHKREGSRIVLDPKRGCNKERGREEEKGKVVVGRERGRDDLNAWLTGSLSRFCCASALPQTLSLQGHRCCSRRDCTDCNEHTNRKVQGIVLDQKRGYAQGKGKKII